MKKCLILFVICFSFVLSGCEKDDICDPATPTTPRVVFSFYDAASPTTLKNVTNLQIIATDQTVTYGVFNGVSKIKVPLNPLKNTCSYRFILNYNNTNPSFVYEAQIEFNYKTQNVYISRACGFKTLYTLLDNNPLLTPASGNWIQQLNLENKEINNENETHIKIYF